MTSIFAPSHKAATIRMLKKTKYFAANTMTQFNAQDQILRSHGHAGDRRAAQLVMGDLGRARSKRVARTPRRLRGDIDCLERSAGVSQSASF